MKRTLNKNATYPTNQVMKGTKVWRVMECSGYCLLVTKTEQGKVFEAAQIR